MRYNSRVQPTDPASADYSPSGKKLRLLIASLGVTLVVALLVYFAWFRSAFPARNYLLSSMPEDAQAVLFIDFEELRHSPVFGDLLAWAPRPEADPDYRQFVHDTGFDYEKDLSAVAIAFEKQGSQRTFFAVADGRFDQKKIKAYAAKNGSSQRSDTGEFFSIPMYSATPPLNFAFAGNGRIVVSNSKDFASVLQAALSKAKTPASTEWLVRFERVAGSPIFGVIRGPALKDYFAPPAASQNLAPRPTGQMSSPQLSSLLGQLQWMTVAGKPEKNTLKVVADGESLEEADAKQLADLLNGVALLARAGLSSVRNQQQIEPGARQSYLALLKSVEVSRIDRGDTKSVRLMFDVTPDLLKSAPHPPSPAPVSK